MPEIELKLAATPDELAKVKNALLAMAGGKRPSSSALSSTYYDTSELKLKQQELTLRVRRQGRRFIQTVKSYDSDGADLMTRGEWEDVILGERPDLHAPESSSRLQEAVREDELRPLFTTTVRRTTIMLEPLPATRIEVALDEGDIRAADSGAVEPISEVELELKSGDPAVLFDVALRLVDVAPLRIETRSKSERGYRLLGPADVKPLAVHAEPIALQPRMTVEETLQDIGRRCLTQLLRNEPAALAEIPDGIHQMRVAARRLRSALSATRPMLPVEHYRWANDELKWLAGALGGARNWDVFTSSLLKPVSRAMAAEQDLQQLSEAAEQRRLIAYEQAKAAIRSPRFTITILKLCRWFEARGWRDQPVSERSAQLLAPIGDLAPGLVERRYRQVRKRSRHFEDLAPEQRHSLRISLKKLRYTIEFLESLFTADGVASFLKQVKPLQDDLGHSNDVRVTRHLMAELQNAHRPAALDRAGGIVLGWHDRGLSDHEPKTREHVRRLRRAKPFW